MNTFCPAKSEWWTLEVFRPFYFEKAKSGDPDSRVDDAEKIKFLDEKKDRAEWGGKIWIKSDVPIIWSQGVMVGQPDFGHGDHWHADFTLGRDAAHVDFICFYRAGPPTGYREYRIFIDQNEAMRGGGWMGFLGGNFARLRNFPLAHVVDGYLIYADIPLQDWQQLEIGELDYPNALSIWKLEKK